MAIVEKLQRLRTSGGTIRTHGLADGAIERFAAVDPRLEQAVDQALSVAECWRSAYPELWTADDAEQQALLQSAYVNFYADDAVNPYVFARNAWEQHEQFLIDGGKGQLGVLAEVIAGLGLAGQIGVVGIAKSRVLSNVKGKVVERTEERFFLPGRKNPVTFRHGSAAAFLLERLRDEAHRFAISFHRNLRSKQGLRSSLDQISGIGPARRKALLKHFGSLKRLREATADQIQQVSGFSAVRAQQLVEALKNQHN